MNSSFELLFRDALERRHRGCFDEAGKIYEQILRQEPGNAKALHLLGVVAAQTGRMERGAELMQRSIAENSGIAPVWADLGRALIALGRFDEAVSSFDEAIALKPDMALAHFNRGVALDDLNRLDEALECYDRVIALDPEDPEAHYNRGLVLRRLLRFDQALLSYDRAIALNPDYTHAYLNRGNILSDLKRYDEAIACFDRVTALEPGYPGIQSLRLGVKRQQCGWHSLDRETADVERGIREGEVADPFSLLGFFDDPSLLRQATENYVNTHCPPNAALGPFGTVSRNSKIRVGYFSGDFHEHATAYLMADLFESHDRDRFEITAFSFGPDAASKMRQRLGLAFDHFVDVQDSTDLAVAQQARALKIDIAVDLKGYTIDSREGIFAYRAAPIQVNYLGFPGTMAAPFMDYIVADHTLIPTSDRDHYSEKIVYLPHSYQPNDRKKLISDRVFTRDQLGLPAEGFVFCCFNNSYKLTPEVFSVWMRVLQRVPRSVLWLLEDHPQVAINLRQEAERRGIDPMRLVFAPRMPLADHLARHRLADLFLDTLPYNAHTTTSDALWASLPVLTCMGRSFAGRVAASLLHAVELPELIAQDLDAYEAHAVELATDRRKMSLFKAKLDQKRLTAPLFDTPRFAKHIESAYAQMLDRYHAGQPPEHLYIQPTV